VTIVTFLNHVSDISHVTPL